MTTRIKTLILRVALPGAFAFFNVCPSSSWAQDAHAHMTEKDRDQESNANALIAIVRQSTERFKDVSVAMAEGYALQFGCVSGEDFGAMGLHYVNGTLVNSGVLDATRPQIIIYEATPNGGRRLIGVDWWRSLPRSPGACGNQA